MKGQNYLIPIIEIALYLALPLLKRYLVSTTLLIKTLEKHRSFYSKTLTIIALGCQENCTKIIFF